MPLYALAAAFTVWMAVEAVRRGDASRWLWIILVFGPLGAAVYFFSEYLESARLTQRAFRPRKVTRADIRRAEMEVRRLDNTDSWIEYASLLRARRDNLRAAEAAQRAIERDPESLEAHYELGLALLAAGRFAQAIEQLDGVVSRDPGFDSDDALYALAKAQLGIGDMAAAKARLEELVQRRGRPEILYDLATAQGALGDRGAAYDALQRIVDEAELVPKYLQSQVRPWVRRARRAMRRLGR